MALHALEEAPQELLDILEEQSDAFLVPRVGNSKNFLWSAVQLNLARAILYGSGECSFLVPYHLQETEQDTAAREKNSERMHKRAMQDELLRTSGRENKAKLRQAKRKVENPLERAYVKRCRTVIFAQTTTSGHPMPQTLTEHLLMNSPPTREP